jgi:hypothetical protein
MFLKKIYRLVMQILINLNIKWNGSDVIVTPPPIDPPVEPPVVVNPPSGVKDITEEWYSKLRDTSVTEIIIDGSCKVTLIEAVEINRKLTIKGINDATIEFGIPYFDVHGDVKQDWNLITLGNGAEVKIEGVNLCLSPQRFGLVSYLPNIFKSLPDHSHTWTALVKDCDTTKLGNRGGMGLGLLYGSASGNYIGAINFKHVGNGFLDAKANIGGQTNGILYVVLDNVITDGTVEEVLNTYKVKVRGKFEPELFTITSDNSVKQIYNHFYNTDNADNFAHILHVDRFTFMLDDNCDINDKQFKLRKNASGLTNVVVRKHWDAGKQRNLTRIYTIGVEGHAGDTFILNNTTYKVLEKGKDENDIWTNNHRPKESKISYTPYLQIDEDIPVGEYQVQWTSSFNLFGIEQDVWMLHKDSRYGFRTYENSIFEAYEVMRGDSIGHNMYNHRNISLWAKDTVQKGFYRQTDQGGKCLGYNMINCNGFKDQFNPPVQVTTDKPIPERIKNLLQWN